MLCNFRLKWHRQLNIIKKKKREKTISVFSCQIACACWIINETHVWCPYQQQVATCNSSPWFLLLAQQLMGNKGEVAVDCHDSPNWKQNNPVGDNWWPSFCFNFQEIVAFKSTPKGFTAVKQTHNWPALIVAQTHRRQERERERRHQAATGADEILWPRRKRIERTTPSIYRKEGSKKKLNLLFLISFFFFVSFILLSCRLLRSSVIAAWYRRLWICIARRSTRLLGFPLYKSHADGTIKNEEEGESDNNEEKILFFNMKKEKNGGEEKGMSAIRPERYPQHQVIDTGLDWWLSHDIRKSQKDFSFRSTHSTVNNNNNNK